MRQPKLKYFGTEVERIFGAAEVKGLLFSASNASTFAAIHIRSGCQANESLRALPTEPSYLIEVQLEKPLPGDWGVWTGEDFHPSPALQAGAVSVFDLEMETLLQRPSAFESVQFNLPKVTLDAYLEEMDLPAIRSLSHSNGKADGTMLHLCRLMASFFEAQQTPSELFSQHYLQMLCSHLVSQYGSLSEAPRIAKGGLAPWQKRRALELLDSSLGGDLRLARLASECGLSGSYFCRCFRTTFGTSVHKFVVKRRIARAKELLLAEQQSLAEIAMETGFSDQAAFSRTFMSVVGTPPAKWRTEQRVARRNGQRSAETKKLVGGPRKQMPDLAAAARERGGREIFLLSKPDRSRPNSNPLMNTEPSGSMGVRAAI